jgi:CubicO group peptidase (beta-lactamase class C family)
MGSAPYCSIIIRELSALTNPFIRKHQNLVDLQNHVQQLLDELAEDDIGAGFQAAAYWRGELVLSAFSGSADSAGRRSVDSDTLFVVQSCSKGIVSTAIHILVQQGKLAYDERISHYWPELGDEW